MKKEFLKNGRVKAAAVMTMLALGVGAAGTMGYFTAQEKVTNVFTVGDLEIGLQEPEWSKEDGDGVNMYPGYSVYKNPTVKNTADTSKGGTDCYTRMRVEILNGEGAPVTDAEALKLIKKTIRFDATYNGTYDKTGKATQLVQGRIPGYFLKEFEDIPMVNPLFVLDGERSTDNVLIYNYQGRDGNGVMKAGEEAALFTNIVIPAEWTQTELRRMGEFQIVVTAQAIQTSGFAKKADAFLALDGEIEKVA